MTTRAAGPALIFAQCGLVLLGTAIVAFRPPETGRMLVIPLWAADGAAVRVTRDHGAALIGAGPVPGSMVIEATDDRLRATAWRAGLLLVAAPPAGCGAA